MAVLMTDAQREQIFTLLREVHGDKAREAFNELVERFPNPSLSDASTIIAELTRAKRKQVLDRLPSGRYALATPDGVERYKVERPDRGRWAGYCFISRLVGSREEALRGQEAHRVRELLELDPLAAAIAYGQHTGVCGMCGRELTSEESKTRGIGPVCEQKLS